MKILVLSDTHEQADNVYRYLNDNDDIDMIINLGDGFLDLKKLEKLKNIKIIEIYGNSDIDRVGKNSEELLEILGKKIFITHGNNYDVKKTLKILAKIGKELNADLVLYGHTHEIFSGEVEGVEMFNPGSPTFSYPIGIKTVGILNINEKVEKKIVNI